MKHAILAVAFLLPLPAYSEAIDIDRSRSLGPTVSITTPSGIACSETAGDRPSLWFGGRIRDQKTNNSKNDLNTTGAVVDQTANNTYINSNLFNDEAGWSVGVGVHIPFGGPPTGNCKRFMAAAEREAKLSMLNKLLESKAITLAQFTEMALALYHDKDLH
jgi:hypothetical protein